MLLATFHHCWSQCPPSYYCPGTICSGVIKFMISLSYYMWQVHGPPTQLIIFNRPQLFCLLLQALLMCGNKHLHLPVMQHYCPITKISITVWNYCFLATVRVFTSQMPHNITKHKGKVGGKMRITTKAVAEWLPAIINLAFKDPTPEYLGKSYSSPLGAANSSAQLSSAVVNSALWLAHCCCVLWSRWQRWSRGSSGSRQRARWITHSWPLTPARTNWSSVPGNPYLSLSFSLPSCLCLLLSVFLWSCLSFPCFFQCLLVHCMSNDQFLYRCLQKPEKNGFGDCFQVYCLCQAQPSVCVCVYMCMCVCLHFLYDWDTEFERDCPHLLINNSAFNCVFLQCSCMHVIKLKPACVLNACACSDWVYTFTLCESLADEVALHFA